MARKHFKKLPARTLLDSYFNPSAGQIPVLFLDSSAVIDIERIVRMPEITKTYPHPSQSASLILSGLEQVSGTLAFCPEILYEIRTHHQNHRINGRREISDGVMTFINSRIHRSKQVTDVSQTFLDVDDDAHYALKQSVYDACLVANKGKKTDIDAISFPDFRLLMHVVSLAAHSSRLARQRVQQLGNVPGIIEGTYRLGLLSSDSHIYRTLDHFLDHDERGIRFKDYLQPFNARNMDFVDLLKHEC